VNWGRPLRKNSPPFPSIFFFPPGSQPVVSFFSDNGYPASTCSLFVPSVFFGVFLFDGQRPGPSFSFHLYHVGPPAGETFPLPRRSHLFFPPPASCCKLPLGRSSRTSFSLFTFKLTLFKLFLFPLSFFFFFFYGMPVFCFFLFRSLG